MLMKEIATYIILNDLYVWERRDAEMIHVKLGRCTRSTITRALDQILPLQQG
jgi:hypothetical protein